MEFFELKTRVFPRQSTTFRRRVGLDLSRGQGSGHLEQIREEGRNQRRYAMRLMDKFLGILEKCRVDVLGRVFVRMWQFR
jgi:hypothetical protein